MEILNESYKRAASKDRMIFLRIWLFIARRKIKLFRQSHVLIMGPLG